AALLASAEGYTPRANAILDAAREEIGAITDIANALAESLPTPKAPARKSRRRRKRRRGPAAENANGGATVEAPASEPQTEPPAGVPADSNSAAA
ncbi:MAG: hypothetical protein ABI927_03075, partial [Gaiellaceae bacterium]